MYGSSLENWGLIAGAQKSPAWNADPFALSGLLASMLDEIDYGLVVLAQDATILLANQLARDELAREKWVRQTGKRLDGCECDSYGGGDAALIEHALQDALRGRRSLISLGGRTHSLALSFVPIQVPCDPALPYSKCPAALVVFGKQAVCEKLTLRMFGDIHGLSGAENQLLPAISCGLSAHAIAQQQHVAVSTVRSQLHSIRAKTGVKSVRTLMARLITLPPVRPLLKSATP